MMEWHVRIDFCANGSSCGHGVVRKLYFPKVRVETQRELTADEKTRIDNAVVVAATKVLVEIESEG